MKLQASFLLFTILISVNSALITSDCANQFQVIIREDTHGLVIDNDGELSFQYFTGGESQIWVFIPTTKPGVYNIQNAEKNWISLEVNPTTGQVLTLETNLENLYQQWYVHIDGTLYNAGTKVALSGNPASGGILKVNKSNPLKFILQETEDKKTINLGLAFKDFDFGLDDLQDY